MYTHTHTHIHMHTGHPSRHGNVSCRLPAGVGVAMGNAVRSVRAAASYVAASHDHDGIAEAFERFVL